MSEFLDMIESISASEASDTRLFGGAGRRSRGIRSNPKYPTMLNEALDLLDRVYAGNRRAALDFEEAMSTSDFPLIFGDVIDRQMVAAYREFPSTIEKIAKTSTVRDFRTVKRNALDGAEGELSSVAQGEEYPEVALSEAQDTFSVGKFGRRLPLFWETLVNDDLDAFRDLPGRLGRAARRTEQRFITSLYMDANGPHASLYTTGHVNKVTSNPVLSVTALQTAYTILAAMTDADGEPIFFDSVYLTVPPALEVTAQNILNGTELWLSEAGGSTNTQLHVNNWMRNKLQLVVDPYIPLVASSAHGSTSWALFGNPADGRAALEFARLRGHEEPEIWVKSSNAMRAGGGEVGPDQGDFETDSIVYRVRKVHGGGQLVSTGGYKATVASNGSGS